MSTDTNSDDETTNEVPTETIEVELDAPRSVMLRELRGLLGDSIDDLLEQHTQQALQRMYDNRSALEAQKVEQEVAESEIADVDAPDPDA